MGTDADAGANADAPSYRRTTLNAKRVGDIGPLWRDHGLSGADEFFSIRPFPVAFLRAHNPPNNFDGQALYTELRLLFHDRVRDHTYVSGEQLRDGVWWSPVYEQRTSIVGGGAAVLIGEVKRDLFDFIDGGYKRSRGGRSNQGYKYAARKRLPTMEWREVTRPATNERWLVLADKGFAQMGGGHQIVGAVRLHASANAPPPKRTQPRALAHNVKYDDCD